MTTEPSSDTVGVAADDGNRWSWGPRFRRWELIVFAVICLAYAGLALYAILLGSPLGHDEAVYALRARSYAEGVGHIGWFWGDHRAPGLPWILQAVFLAGDSAPYLRLGVAALTGSGVVLTWLVGRYLFNPAVGLIAAAGLGLTPLWLVVSTQVWPDGPGAAIGLAVIAVLLFGTSGTKASWWVLLAIPLTIAATVVRYGAPITLGVAGMAVLGWRWRLWKTSAPQIAAVAIGAGIPSAYLVFSRALTTNRSPYEATAGFVEANAPSILDGWAGYGRALGSLITGPGVILMVLGLVLAIFAVHGHRSATRLSLVIAGLTFAVLASTLPAETRYMAPVLPWLWMVAAVGLVAAAGTLERKTVWATAVATGLLLILPASVALDDIDQNTKRQFGVLKTAASDYPWQPGCVISTTYRPQVGWYSGCAGVTLGREGDPAIDPDATNVFWVQDGKRQSDAFEDWRLTTTDPMTSFGDEADGGLQYIEIYDLTQ